MAQESKENMEFIDKWRKERIHEVLKYESSKEVLECYERVIQLSIDIYTKHGEFLLVEIERKNLNYYLSLRQELYSF